MLGIILFHGFCYYFSTCFSSFHMLAYCGEYVTLSVTISSILSYSYHSTTVIFLQFFTLVILAQEQVKYNVISLLPKDDAAANMAVVVDDHPYPLESTTSSSILFAGSAPAAQHHYYYAKVKQDGSVIEKESFQRKPFDGDTTPNEHYNRSWNKWEITQLPNVLEPLPSIHRIKSDLHNDGEISTIHIVADAKQIQNMHEHSQDDIQVMTNMTFIR